MCPSHLTIIAESCKGSIGRLSLKVRFGGQNSDMTRKGHGTDKQRDKFASKWVIDFDEHSDRAELSALLFSGSPPVSSQANHVVDMCSDLCSEA